MNVLDDTSLHILQLLSNFNTFLKIIENTQWTRKATSEIIKNSFKLASFIEKVIANLNSKGITIQFLNAFKNWLWHNEKRIMMYESSYFEYASDYVLEVLLFNRAVRIISSDIALRIYTSLYPVERLQKFLKCKIIKHSSYDVLLTNIIETSFVPKEIEAALILKDWEKLLNEGCTENVRINVYEMFSNYRLSKSLPVLLKILCIPESSSCHKDIQDIIMERLQEKLIDRTTLNKDFWNFIFKELDSTILATVCSNNDTVRDMIFNCIEYTGSMMSIVIINSQRSWTPSSEFSLYPEITYSDLYKVIKAVCNTNYETRDVIVAKISEAHKISSSQLWEDILFSL